jgi:hypothetical protein
MKIEHYSYQVRFRVRFTLEEARLLKQASLDHYDRRCWEQSQEGGWLNSLERIIAHGNGDQPGSYTWDLGWSDLNLLAKTVEFLCMRVTPEMRAIQTKVWDLFRYMQQEYERVDRLVNHD